MLTPVYASVYFPSIVLTLNRVSSLPCCRTDRKIHDKNGEITILRDQLKEMEEVLDQERKEVVHLQEGLRLRQGSLDMQQRQQQQQHQGQQVGGVVRSGEAYPVQSVELMSRT